MTTSKALLALAERVEREGASRELDAEIWMTLNPAWRGYPRDDQNGQPAWITPKDGRAQLSDFYSESVDAAMALVDRSRHLSLEDDPSAGGNHAHAAIARMYFGHAKTIAAALTAAALRAHSAQRGEKG